LQLTIEKLVYGGDGLARLPADEHGRGKAAFLPFVLPGEEVEAQIVEQKPGFVRAGLENILRPSPQRVQPRCPYFQKCGGCQYQHASYAHQLEIKANVLKENLRRIARLELETELQLHPSPPWNYRNRTRMKVRPAGEFALGYYRFGSHELLPVEECPISSPLINQAISALWRAGRAGEVPGGVQEAEFFANAEDTQLLAEIYCAPEISQQAAEELAHTFRRVLAMTGVVVFRSAVGSAAEPTRLGFSGATELSYTAGNLSCRVSAGAFFQVNRHLIDNLIKTATAGYEGRMALDLYAGGGLFATALARSFAQVIAVESSQISHADLLYNAPRNVEAVRAQVERWMGSAGKLSPDFVLVDPPRGGLGERVVRGLAVMQAPRMAYLSCDPATLARDLSGLIKAGYRVEQAHLVDLFPQTYHLESVFHLVR
jgi:23S rRNA (uracil1939-C5)-methyltransferase